jgi:hydrogenase expression/formation protein HypC
VSSEAVACSCITCGDVAVPLRVIELDGTGLALCEDEHGRRAEIEVALVAPIEPGEGVLAHAGAAIAKLSPEAVA